MTKQELTRLLHFPIAWLNWDMYPHELFEIQRADYYPGAEQASEHYRYGAFRWWLMQSFTGEQAAKLLALTFLDPDQAMANSARADLLASLRLPSGLQELARLKA